MLLVAAKSFSDKTSRMGASLTQVIPAEDSGEPEMAELPESWKTFKSTEAIRIFRRTRGDRTFMGI